MTQKLTPEQTRKLIDVIFGKGYTPKSQPEGYDVDGNWHDGKGNIVSEEVNA